MHGRDKKYNILFRNLKGGEHMEDLETDGRLILEWILGREDGKL
jgi:hypothetical protein